MPREPKRNQKKVVSDSERLLRIYFLDEDGNNIRVLQDRFEVIKGLPVRFRGHLDFLPRVGEYLVSRDQTVRYKVLRIEHQLVSSLRVPPRIFVILEKVSA